MTFDIDANGIVNVSAKDLGTGREQHITVTASSNLSKDDIDKAVREAEQYAAEDAKRKEEVDTRNHADQMIYQSEKTIADLGDKLESGDKATIQAAIEKVRTALKGTDTESIKAATEELSKAFYAASEKIYSQAAQPGADPNAGAQEGPQDGGQYYDADYEVVDDDKDGSK